MTVHATGRPITRLEAARAQAERALGARTAKRIAMFDNGALYVGAGSGRQFLAWLIDFTVYLFGVGAGLVAVALADRAMDLSDDIVTVLFLSMFVLIPLLYSLCFGNGRALGAVLTGTQLVRVKDGSRIGLKAWWAMLVRTLFLPVMIIVAMLNAFNNGGGQLAGSLVRISIDPTATRQLHTAGIR
ncbi:hypothetical protein QQG74_25790 [Micromonospora sp. FIMYZ51]|uniref:hypothetical protein n=1 Tax=Micromonospora sp. FIMYZ51 TaxID=3051832 RepID=UPI00311EB19E